MIFGRINVLWLTAIFNKKTKKIANFLKKIEKIFKKVLTKAFWSAIIQSNLNITKNDCDEEGRNLVFTESCRLV